MSNPNDIILSTADIVSNPLGGGAVQLANKDKDKPAQHKSYSSTSRANTHLTHDIDDHDPEPAVRDKSNSASNKSGKSTFVIKIALIIFLLIVIIAVVIGTLYAKNMLGNSNNNGSSRNANSNDNNKIINNSTSNTTTSPSAPPSPSNQPSQSTTASSITISPSSSSSPSPSLAPSSSSSSSSSTTTTSTTTTSSASASSSLPSSPSPSSLFSPSPSPTSMTSTSLVSSSPSPSTSSSSSSSPSPSPSPSPSTPSSSSSSPSSSSSSSPSSASPSPSPSSSPSTICLPSIPLNQLVNEEITFQAFFQLPSSWSSPPNVYAFNQLNGNIHYFGGWPGSLSLPSSSPSSSSSSSLWFSSPVVTLPFSSLNSSVVFIFSNTVANANGNKPQTANLNCDMPYPTTSTNVNCYFASCSPPSSSSTVYNCANQTQTDPRLSITQSTTPICPTPMFQYRAFMQLPSGWSAPSVYAYNALTGTQFFGSFPGVSAVLDSSSSSSSLSWYRSPSLSSYALDVVFIFTSGVGGQTSNLPCSYSSSLSLNVTCFYFNCASSNCLNITSTDPRSILPTSSPSGAPSIIPYIVPSSRSQLMIPPDINVYGVGGVKNWSSAIVQDALVDFTSTGYARHPSPDFWGSQVVYSMMVDRFNDGDPNNNLNNINAYQAQNNAPNNQQGIYGFRHGGDIQGIINRLDYIVDLGASSLWVTPVFVNDGSYHGYCVVDPSNIDSGFGTRELFRELVKQAHDRNLTVILDIVINHLCDSNTKYSVTPDHTNCPNDLGVNYWNGVQNVISSSGQLSFSSSFFGPFKTQSFFNRCGSDSSAEISSQTNAALFGDFAQGFYDYNTMNEDWQVIFTQIHQYWIAYSDVDGYRLDATKHVTDFVAYFSTNLRSFARSLGKKNFLVLGEVAASAGWIAERLGQQMVNPLNISQHGTVPATLLQRLPALQSTYLSDPVNPYSGLNSVYNFEESGDAVSWLRLSGSVGTVSSYFSSTDYATIAAQGDVRFNWVCIEIQDWVRFLSVAGVNNNALFSATGNLLTGYGFPVLYYGIEQGFNGLCQGVNISLPSSGSVSSVQSICSGASDDSLKRQDMFVSGPWRLGATTQQAMSLAGIGYGSASPFVNYSSWRLDPFLSTSGAPYQWIRTLLRVRRSCSVLSLGFTYFRYTDPYGKLGIFSRLIANSDEIIVAINPYSASITLPSSFFIDATVNANRLGDLYVNVFSSSQSCTVTSSGSGSYSCSPGNALSIPAYGTMIFVHQQNIDWTTMQTVGAGLCRT